MLLNLQFKVCPKTDANSETFSKRYFETHCLIQTMAIFFKNSSKISPVTFTETDHNYYRLS